MCYPRPLQAHVPIWVGGSGERKTLRLVAELADACNLFGDPDVVRRKVDVLHRHCADVGRDPTTIEVTHLSTVLVGRDRCGGRRARRSVAAEAPPGGALRRVTSTPARSTITSPGSSATASPASAR